MKKVIAFFLIIFWSTIVDARVRYVSHFHSSKNGHISPTAERVFDFIFWLVVIFFAFFVFINIVVAKDEYKKLKAEQEGKNKKEVPLIENKKSVNKEIKKIEVYKLKKFKKKRINKKK
jgi:preprotein translocase subunit SecG